MKPSSDAEDLIQPEDDEHSQPTTNRFHLFLTAYPGVSFFSFLACNCSFIILTIALLAGGVAVISGE
jgi:hypothetical protein